MQASAAPAPLSVPKPSAAAQSLILKAHHNHHHCHRHCWHDHHGHHQCRWAAPTDINSNLSVGRRCGGRPEITETLNASAPTPRRVQWPPISTMRCVSVCERARIGRAGSRQSAYDTLERLMPAFHLALCLRMVRRSANVFHLLCIQPLRQISRDVAGTIIAEQARLMDDPCLGYSLRPPEQDPACRSRPAPSSSRTVSRR